MKLSLDIIIETLGRRVTDEEDWMECFDGCEITDIKKINNYLLMFTVTKWSDNETREAFGSDTLEIRISRHFMTGEESISDIRKYIAPKFKEGDYVVYEYHTETESFEPIDVCCLFIKSIEDSDCKHDWIFGDFHVDLETGEVISDKRDKILLYFEYDKRKILWLNHQVDVRKATDEEIDFANRLLADRNQTYRKGEGVVDLYQPKVGDIVAYRDELGYYELALYEGSEKGYDFCHYYIESHDLDYGYREYFDWTRRTPACEEDKARFWKLMKERLINNFFNIMGKIQKKRSLLKIAETCKEVEVYSPLNGSEFTDWNNIRPFDFDLTELPATFTGAHRVNGDTLEVVYEYKAPEVKEKRGGAREGAGKPSKYKGEPKSRLVLYTLDRALDLLNEEAERTGESRSDIVSSLILEGIRHIDYEEELKSEGFQTFVDIDDVATHFTAIKGDWVVTIEKGPCYCQVNGDEDLCNKAWKEVYDKIF